MSHWKRNGWKVIPILLSLLSLTAIRAQVSPLVLTQQKVSSPNGASLSSIRGAKANNWNQHVFLASIYSNTLQRAIYRESDGELTLVALSGQPLPESQEQTFGYFENPRINDRGTIAFDAVISGQQGTSRALFLKKTSSFIRLVDTEMEAPGAPGQRFDSFEDIQLNNRDEVAFLATLTAGAVRNGLFVASVDGLKPILLDGQQVDGYTFSSISSFSLNNVGQMAIVARRSNLAGLFLFNGDTFVDIAISRQQVPDTNRFMFSFSHPRLNDRQEVAFLSFLGPANQVVYPSDTPYVNAVIRWQAGRIQKIISGEENFFTGLDVISFSGPFSDLCLNNVGTIVFKIPTCNISTHVVRFSIFSYSDSRITQQVSEGDTVPSEGPIDVILDQPISLNDNDEITFMAKYSRLPTSLFGLFRIFRNGSVASNLYFPQIADGINQDYTWKTTFFLVNRSSTTASATLSFYGENGSALQVNLQNINASRFTYELPPSGTLSVSTAPISDLRSGWAMLSSNVKIDGTAIFSLTDRAGKLISNVTVPASPELDSFSLLAELQPGTNTGYALANAGNASATVTLTLRNNAGVRAAVKVITLQPMAHFSRFLTELFDMPKNFHGRVDFTCSRPILALGLLQQDLVFTSLPAIP